jgi:hypothetical protein
MAWMDPLTATLLDLLFELREHPIPFTIGGGFGLYLKRRQLDQTGERTLFSQLPMPRATNDLDLYTIVAMQVESEYQESLRLGNQYGGDGHVQTAREIIRDDFAAPTSIGVIRLREHPLFRPEFPVPDFLAVLGEIFHGS